MEEKDWRWGCWKRLAEPPVPGNGPRAYNEASLYRPVEEESVL